MKIYEKKTRFHRFAFEFPYHPEKVMFCRLVKDTFSWKEFSFDSEAKVWVFSKPEIVQALKEKYPTIEIAEEVLGQCEMLRLADEAYEKQVARSSEIKKATDSNLVVPIKGDLYPYQKIGVEFLLNNKGNALLCDTQGLGKSKTYLGYFTLSGHKRCIIVCPASMKYVWENEVLKWTDYKAYVVKSNTKFDKIPSDVEIIIINYDLLVKFAKQLVECGATSIALDESHYCFPYETIVATERGPMMIGDIVEHDINIRVFSHNEDSGVVELHYVKSRFKSPNDIDLVEVTHEKGSFTCTKTHKIWTKAGYKEALFLLAEDNLCVLQKGVLCGQTPKPYRKILWKKLLSKMADATTIFRSRKEEIRGSGRTCTHRCSEPVGFYTDEEDEQEQGIQQKKMGRIQEILEGEFHVSFPRWQREINSATDEDWGVNRTSYGIRDINPSCEGIFPEPSNTLHSGSRVSGKEGGNRNRWKLPSNKEVEIPGQKERIHLEISRVVSVKVLEQGSKCGSTTRGRRDTHVYNLEVEKNHNYFASGVLVSNCKSPKAKRTKAAMIIAKRMESVTCMTGTPVLSRPIELYPILKLIDGKHWANWMEYAVKYCEGRHGRFGFDASGASNISELRERISQYFLRRTKEEVLPDLPPKRHIHYPVEIDEEHAKLYKVANDNLVRFLRENRGKKDPEIVKSMQAEKLVKLNILREISALGKIDAAAELVHNILDSGEKVIVFSSFIKPLDELKNRFPDAVTITGQTPLNERPLIVKQFQEDPNTRVFLGGIKSAGVGITLTAAQSVIFLDLSWTPADHFQAEDRAHRIGSKHESIDIYQLSAHGTMDEFMNDLLEPKRQLFKELVDYGAPSMQESIIGDVLQRIEEETD